MDTTYLQMLENWLDPANPKHATKDYSENYQSDNKGRFFDWLNPTVVAEEHFPKYDMSRILVELIGGLGRG